MATQYLDLEITLEKADDGGYSAALRVERTDLGRVGRNIAAGRTGLDSDDPLKEFLLLLDPVAYGKLLFERLLPSGKLRDEFNRVRGLAAEPNKGLRLRLHISVDADVLQRLHWEKLYDPASGVGLATNERVVFSRLLDQDGQQLLAVPATPTALLVVANPSFLPDYKLHPIAVEGEVARAHAALRGVTITELVAPGTATLDNLVEHLRHRPGYDFVYLVAHGQLRANGEALLWLDVPAGGVEGPVAGAEVLRRLVAANLAHPPRLLVLTSCESAGAAAQGVDLAALGPQLARDFCPAVLAMQGPLTMATADRFMPELFRRLLDEGEIDRAVAAARSKVSDRYDAWAPTLFLGLKDPRIWPRPAQKVPWSVPYQRNPLFTGRDDELAALEKMLAEQRLAVVLSGSGGMGKTQLAAELAYRARESGRYPGGVLWLTMDPPESIAGQVAALAAPDALDLPDYSSTDFARNLAAAKAALRDDAPRLLIFDNLEDPTLLDEWRPNIGGARVLVTTRRGAWLTDNSESLPLKELAPAAARTLLLQRRANRLKRPLESLLADAETAQQADAICEAVGYLPLALAVAAAYLAAYPDETLPRYHEQLQRAPVEQLELSAAQFDEQLPGKHEKSIIATFYASYKALQPAAPTDALALTLLHRAAWCAPVAIPRRLLLRAAALDPDDEDSAAAARPALRRLHTLGLLDALPDGDQRLHRLIAAYARSRPRPAEEDTKAVEQALYVEVNAINAAGYPLAGVPYLDHLREAIERAAPRADVKAARLLNEQGALLRAQGELAAARPLYERALAIREQVCGANHPDTAKSLNNLASLLRAQGELAAARPLYERALAIREQVLGANHPDTAKSLNDLAGLLQDQGELAAARPLYERALAIYEMVRGANHPHTATSLNNLAALLRAQGELAAARPLYERALAIREQVRGTNHPNTATSLNNLAALLQAQGELTAARPLYERALAIREQVLGANHHDTAQSLNNLAVLLQAQGELAAARPLYERALAIREQVLGANHPDTASSVNNLAYLLRAEGNLAAARPLYERALAIREQMLGANHPDTAQSLNNLAVLLQAQGDLAAARSLFERALTITEQVLGPNHPDTATSVNNLAGLLQAQGELAAARPLFERALAILRKSLGPDHPTTRIVQGNLEGLLEEMAQAGEDRR